MKRHRSAWSTMIGFILTLVVLLVCACSSSRTAWSFSADVPSPVLASITGGGEAGSAEAVPTTAESGKGANVVNGAAPAPEQTSAAPGAAAPTGDASSSGGSQVRKGSSWPAIFLGTLVVIGVILVVVYFLTRERDD
mgnify:CR=1 FL=1